MTRNPKIVIPVVALTAALAGYWYLALAPKREEAARLGDQIAVKQAELTQAQSTLAGYQRAQKDYPANVNMVARLGKAVPGDDDVRSLMVQLDAAASSSGVDFRTITVGSANGAAPSDAPSPGAAAKLPPGAVAVGSTGISAVPFTFTFQGSFFNVSSFFSRLERFVTVANQRIRVTGRLLRLESISLKPGSAGFPEIKADINASSYLVPPTPEVSGTAAPGATDDPSAPGGAPTGGSSAPPTTAATSTGAVQ